ncbi:MAG: hypothetical protein IPI24_02155 [Ignavibacteria bacterium]|nr:hypothetical protein [Ignavibacteria bacterium]
MSISEDVPPFSWTHVQYTDLYGYSTTNSSPFGPQEEHAGHHRDDGVSRNTLRKYQARFDRSGIGIDQLLNLSDKELHDLFLRSPEPQPNRRIQDLFTLMPRYERELKRRSVTRRLLWKEYRAAHPRRLRSHAVQSLHKCVVETGAARDAHRTQGR